jgi:hypothetical protein
LASALDGWPASPWEHGSSEGSTVVLPGQQPLVYKGGEQIFDREREAGFAYNPRFLPGVVSFDARNRPYMRVGVHEPAVLAESYDGPRHSTRGEPRSWVAAYLQTIDDRGQWVAQPVQPEPVRSGHFLGHQRVVFTEAGEAYQLVSKRTALGEVSFLLVSTDGMRTWLSEPMPSEYRYERLEPAGPAGGVLIVATGSDGGLSLATASTEPDGGLVVRSPVPMAVPIEGELDPRLAPVHSGAGNVTATVVDRTGTPITYLVFLNGVDDPAVPPGETAQYAVAFDHGAEVALNLQSPVLLGSTLNHTDPPTADRHNGPAIVVDSDGRLHVVLGSHQRHLKHTCTRRSARERPAFSADDWFPAQTIHADAPYEQVGATYVGLVIDSRDTLHVVTRGYPYHLTYLRARRSPAARVIDQWQWDPPKHVIEHQRQGYGIYYHKLAIDRRDRLFASYWYFAFRLTPEEEEVYRNRWPDEVTDNGEIDHHPHDPVLLMSDDAGDSWRLATTDDLFAEVLPSDPLEPAAKQ